MSLIINSLGAGGLLQFQNLTPLALSVIGENIPRFWDLPHPAQMETLASAYHHLSGITEPNDDQRALVDKLGAMIQRFEKREPTIAADNFLLARLVGEMAKLRNSERPEASEGPVVVAGGLPAVEGGSKRRRETSLMPYQPGAQGFFPMQWAHLSEDMRRELKSLALARDGKMNELSGDEKTHAEFLFGALESRIQEVHEFLESGARGAGQSGTASGPSIQGPLALIDGMTAFMTEPHSEIAPHFWRLYGAHVALRKTVNRLTSQRMLLSTLEEGQRAALDHALFHLDVAYLRVLLLPQIFQIDAGSGEPGNKDENYGDRLAITLGDSLINLPLSDRSELTPTARVHLTSAASSLRILLRELVANPPSPAVRGFLKRISPREMLQLPQVVALLEASQASHDS